MWKILVADDSSMNCEFVLEALSEIAQCDLVTSGEEALVAWNKSMQSPEAQYDMILLDVAMPGIDGISVLKAIRQKEELLGIRLGYGVPIVMVTAHREQFMDSFNNGCDDYLLKPIDPEHLIKKVKEKLEKNSSKN